MKANIEERDNVSVLRLQGDLTVRNDFKRSMSKLTAQRHHRIILELSRVEMIGSADLAHLMEMTARSNSEGGRIVLASPSPFVTGVLSTTKLDQYFEVFDDVENAIAAIG